jgi:hypothetical protein
MAAAFRLSDSRRERGVVIGGDDLPPGSPAFIRVLPRAGEPAIALYDGRRGRHRTAGSRPKIAVNTRGVLSERRRRFPQVLTDDEGGLRRETHRTAISGDTSEHR